MNLFKGFFFIIIPILIIGFFVLITISGPKTVDPNLDSKSVLEEISKDHEELRFKSLDFEGQFEEIMSLRQYTKQDLVLLKQAVSFQEAYLNALPYFSISDNQRLDFLRERYDQLASEEHYLKSKQSEMLSKKNYEAKDYGDAVSELNIALEEQVLINEYYPLSAHYNINRVTQIKRTLEYYNAYPIYNEIQKLEAQALALANSKKWLEAAEIMEIVVEKQLYLNSEFRSSRLADSFKISRLKRALFKYRSEPLYGKIHKATVEGDRFVQEQNYMQAAAYYEQALEYQIKLNDEFSNSPYSSRDKVKDLTVRAQTAGSYDIGEMINTLNFKIDRDLRNRNIAEAKDKIVRISDAMQRVNEEFPRSSYNDQKLESKIKFLNFIRNDIILIQDRVYEGLINVPDEPGVQIYNSEVSQGFYLTLIGGNPSRFKNDQNPVESVSWEDANKFCERLSWIMGWGVRLPKEYEFRSSIGRLRYIKLEKHVVSYEENRGVANIKSRAPIGDGFYDLLGNISEWLYSEEAYLNEPAKHIGGHFRDSLEAIYSVPLRTANRNEKSRLIGFRFVLE